MSWTFTHDEKAKKIAAEFKKTAKALTSGKRARGAVTPSGETAAPTDHDEIAQPFLDVQAQFLAELARIYPKKRVKVLSMCHMQDNGGRVAFQFELVDDA